MSPEIRGMLDAMYDARWVVETINYFVDSLRKCVIVPFFVNRLPEKWARISWMSTTLGFWFTELLERDGQFRRWCYHGRPKV